MYRLKSVPLLALLPLTVAAAPLPAPRLDAGVARALQQYLVQQAQASDLHNARFELSLLGGNAPPSTSCRTPPAIEALDMRYTSRMRFRATCADAGATWQYEFLVRAALSAEVVVAASSIPAKRPIGASDVQLEQRPLEKLSSATSKLEAVIGQSSRRPLRTGQVVLTPFLEAAVLVRRGQAVRISMRRGLVQVDSLGEALDAGSLGDMVRVRNTSSGKTIQARVAGNAAVEPMEMAMPSTP